MGNITENGVVKLHKRLCFFSPLLSLLNKQCYYKFSIVKSGVTIEGVNRKTTLDKSRIVIYIYSATASLGILCTSHAAVISSILSTQISLV
jgi:hypothetical protein